MKHFILLSFLLCSLLLSGCIVVPVPHKRLHEIGIKGRIIDVDTHAPVVAARVEDTVDSTMFTYSAVNGNFDLKPVYKMHGAYVWTGVSASVFPNYEAPGSTRTITIIAPGYQNLTVPLSRSGEHDTYIDAGTLLLRR
jgi:hypothetical protein